MTPQTRSQEEEQTGEVRPTEPRPAIETFVDEVKADAERAPGTYARETIVPEGGE